jgi:PKHD-type hydroxylase
LSEYFLKTNSTEFTATQILYEKAFTPDECRKIIEMTKKLPEVEITPGMANINPARKNVNSKYIKMNEQSAWIAQRIMKIVEQANEKFYKIKLHSLAELQLAEYNEGSRYDWHMDANGQKAYQDRKISIVVFLSDPKEYEGGKLHWIPALNNVLMEQGFIVLFPSFKVSKLTPVKKGTRYTLEAWAHGENH